jgi:3-hydroxyacyl-[acyl-carrier-protein] dehydratase
MILLNDLFYIKELELLEGEIHAVLNINANHQILDGHFPGFPVMPGVCMMQMVREVFEEARGVAVRIIKGDNMKFLAVLQPNQYPQVKLSISHQSEDSEYSVIANLFSMTVEPTSGLPITFFKFKGTYREESSFSQ